MAPPGPGSLESNSRLGFDYGKEMNNAAIDMVLEAHEHFGIDASSKAK
jgi:hypothetical protein